VRTSNIAINSELETVREKASRFRHLHGRTEENHEVTQVRCRSPGDFPDCRLPVRGQNRHTWRQLDWH